MYGIASMGMTLVILTGGNDLSAGSVMALSGVVGAGLLGNAISAANPVKLPFAPLRWPLLLTACGFIGLMNGLCIAKLKIAPFVATLAMMSIARSLVYVTADSVVQGVPDRRSRLWTTAIPCWDRGHIDRAGPASVIPGRVPSALCIS